MQQRGTALSGIAYFYLIEDTDSQVRAEQTCAVLAFQRTCHSADEERRACK
jgi:hypothetical protein